jgi:hypothetical protein
MSKKSKSSRIKRTKLKADGFTPTYIRANANDPNSPILEATVMDEDGEMVRLYMAPPKDGN